RVFAVAGWYGTNAWRGLEGDWRRLLRSRRPRVKKMATSDCYNGLHDFSHKKWTLRRRLRLIDRFVRIAALHEIQGAGCIGLQSGPDIPPIRPVRSFDYYYALGMVMHTLAGMAMNCAPGERIAFIVDRRDKFTETIESIHLVTPISKHIFGDNK